MKRISVDIGGTFTDCFVAWDGRYIQAKALTTHHNLSQGFNEALDHACATLDLPRDGVLGEVDSVRYATTLGTNALIERRGPQVGVVVTAGFEATIPLSRGRGYGEGLDELAKNDMSSGTRPDPLVPQTLIRSVSERVDFRGTVLLELDRQDVRRALTELVDAGAEALVVCLTNAVENPVHELAVQEIFLSEYPAHQLGAIPMLLSHQLSGRKGEYVRATSAIVDGYLHATMYHALSELEQNLREHGYARPMLVIHNSGGMAQLNSTDALQTIHSGPVAGISASEHLAGQAGLGNVVATDMGGTSFDIGLVPADGVKHYDFMPVIDRWLVSVPMIHLVTLGAGGGSIAWRDPGGALRVGPRSAGADPGPACYGRGGIEPTVTDANLLLGYLSAENELAGGVALDPRAAETAVGELGAELGLDLIACAEGIIRVANAEMIQALRVITVERGVDPRRYALLAFGGAGPLHAAAIADELGIRTIVCPRASGVLAALGLIVAPRRRDAQRTVLLSGEALSDEALRETVSELGDDARRALGEPDAGLTAVYELRYRGQAFELAITAGVGPSPSELREAFEDEHEERYGYRDPAQELELVTVRVAAALAGAEPDLTADDNQSSPREAELTRQATFRGETLDVQLLRGALASGTKISGPAVVELPEATLLVPPEWSGHVDPTGTIRLER